MLKFLGNFGNPVVTPLVTKTPPSPYHNKIRARPCPRDGLPSRFSLETSRAFRKLWYRYKNKYVDQHGTHTDCFYDFLPRGRLINNLLGHNHSWGLSLTGGWIDFLANILQVTIHLWSTPWAAQHNNFYHPHPSFIPFGGNVELPFERIVSSHNSVFIRIDIAQPNKDNLDYLHARLHGLTPFRIVLLVNRSTDCPWTSFMDLWVNSGKGRLLGGIDSLSLKSYPEGGP